MLAASKVVIVSSARPKATLAESDAQPLAAALAVASFTLK